MSPSAITILETPLFKRHSTISGHLSGKGLVWGKKKIFELTGVGDYGGYPRGIVDKVASDPTVEGRYLGRSYGGFMDQFYIDPGSSVGDGWKKNDYAGPWFAD